MVVKLVESLRMKNSCCVKCFILFAVLWAPLSICAQELYVDDNYKHVYDVVQEEAKNGNVVAIKEMGDIYNFGSQHMPSCYVDIDYQKAMKYYLKAADYGYPFAQWEIARMYYLGKGVEADKRKDKEWRDKAFSNFKIYAENGDAYAMGHLVDYYNGIEDDEYKDYIKAFYWAFRELEAGLPSGASSIASLYEYGEGVEKNVSISYIWCARFCIEAKKKNWPVTMYTDYKKLKSAGLTEADWSNLASFTYGIYIPHVSVGDDEGISNAVASALKALVGKNEQITSIVNSNKSSQGNANSTSTDVVKNLFDVAYNTPDSEAQKKYNRYMKVIQADPYNKIGYKAMAYNNLGVLYESLGDLKNAKACYEYALQANPNYDKAKDNLKGVKAKRRNQLWNNVGNALGSVGQVLGTISRTQLNETLNESYQGSGGSLSNGHSGGSVCKRCQGSGRCSSMSGTANKYYCHGSGKCGYCYGKGTIRKLGQTITCTACDGNGKCKYCNGSGRCSDCNGSGK